MTAPAPPEYRPRPTRPWCLFLSGSEPLAVGLEAVAEVVEIERLVRLPHSPPRVLGLCTLRREVIPVIGLHGDDLQDSGAKRQKSLVLILRTGQGPWALRVSYDGTVVAEEPWDEIPPPPESLGECPVYIGRVIRGSTTHAVVDPAATWRVLREGVENWYADHWTRSTHSRPGLTPAVDPARSPSRNATRTGVRGTS